MSQIVLNTDRLPSGFWARLASLPGVTTVFVGIVGLMMLLIAFGNMTDYGSNFAFVQHVLSMDTNFGEALMYRSINDEWLWHAFYIFLITLESLAGIVLIIGFFRLWGYVFGGTSHSQGARLTASFGLLLCIIIFAGGFLVVGGEWFAMWQGKWNGTDAAIRNTILASIPLILLHLPSASWNKE
ncbi:MAG: DUF2165 domain-containing protein [Microbacteriaceae bacterium]